jgi:hypothetical protein
MHEGRKYFFRTPGASRTGDLALAPKTKALGYFHPDDPRFLHLTTGDGAVLGTWLRRDLATDRNAVAEAIRYATTALNSAKARATELAAPDANRLDAIREHNAGVMQFGDFIEVTPAATQTGNTISSPVASAIAGVKHEKRETKKQQLRRDDDERIAREALEL